MAANISVLTCDSMSSMHGFTISIHAFVACRVSVGLSKPKKV